MRPIDEIVVHCLATPEGRVVSVKEIDDWHRARGWSGIGYHQGRGLDGEVMVGRSIERIGAHVAGRNERTIGLFYVGGLAKDGKTPKDTRTAAQRAGLVADLHDLTQRFPTIKKISGHRDYAAKACPSFDATAEYASLGKASVGVVTRPDAILRRGDVGSAVRMWRADLASWRRLIGHQWPVAPGDVFDQTVELVTREFQQSRGIVADGQVGPQSRDEMALALLGKPPFQAIPRPSDENVAAALLKLQEAIVLLGAH